MPHLHDIPGQRFGRLIVVKPVTLGGNGKHAVWQCVCDCGGTIETRSDLLVRGVTKACGCRKGKVGTGSLRHGQSSTPEYKAWRGMKQRCLNPKEPSWKNYGGRGITVCQEWLTCFERFLADVGPRPGPEYSIDRKDNNGNYEPGNCRWATRIEQNNNMRRRGPNGQ